MKTYPDGGEPITRDWLRSIGIFGNEVDTEYEVEISVDDRTEIRGEPGEVSTVLGYSFTDEVVYIETFTWNYNQLATEHGTGVDETIILGPRKTRGEFRLLLRALGAWDDETQREKRSATRTQPTAPTESPDDDAQPLTADWLEQTGWTRYRNQPHDRRWKLVVCVQNHGPGQGTTTHWLDIHEPIVGTDGLAWWPMNFWQQHDTDKKADGVALLSWVERTTRGHVRRLRVVLEDRL